MNQVSQPAGFGNIQLILNLIPYTYIILLLFSEYIYIYIDFGSVTVLVIRKKMLKHCASNGATPTHGVRLVVKKLRLKQLRTSESTNTPARTTMTTINETPNK